MSQLLDPPFRADQVGSLLRPDHLHEARRRATSGELSPAELHAIEDEAIIDLIKKEEATGLLSATDGEFRRASWNGDFVSRVRGTAAGIGPLARTTWYQAPGAKLELDPGQPAPPPRNSMGVNAKLGLDGVIFADDFTFLRDHCTSATPKICIPSPSMLHYRGGNAAIDRSVYPDLDEYWADLVEVWVAELQGLAALGCTYLQLDDTSYSFLLDPQEQADLAARGSDPMEQQARYVDTVNKVLARRPEGMRITLHTCRGNMQSAWAASGGYEPIAEFVLAALNVDGLFLEFDDERSGSLEILRFIPPSRRVVLGLVSSKTPALEDLPTLQRRVEEASKYFPVDNLCLSTQCGFASTEPGNHLTEEEQFAKLRLVVEAASKIWG